VTGRPFPGGCHWCHSHHAHAELQRNDSFAGQLAETQLNHDDTGIGLLLGPILEPPLWLSSLPEKDNGLCLLLVAAGIGLETIARRRFLKICGTGDLWIRYGLFREVSYVRLRYGRSRIIRWPTRSLNFSPSIPGGPHRGPVVHCVVHTSAVTIGIAIALSVCRSFVVRAAIPIVLGANVGTCITASWRRCCGV
jgi:hypothetical protein